MSPSLRSHHELSPNRCVLATNQHLLLTAAVPLRRQSRFLGVSVGSVLHLVPCHCDFCCA